MPWVIGGESFQLCHRFLQGAEFEVAVSLSDCDGGVSEDFADGVKIDAGSEKK